MWQGAYSPNSSHFNKMILCTWSLTDFITQKCAQKRQMFDKVCLSRSRWSLLRKNININNDGSRLKRWMETWDLLQKNHSSINSCCLKLYYEVLPILKSHFYFSGLAESKMNYSAYLHIHIEMLKKCCLPSAAALCNTGNEDAIYIFNKTFKLNFLVHHGSILRNTVACWVGVLDSDPYP